MSEKSDIITYGLFLKYIDVYTPKIRYEGEGARFCDFICPACIVSKECYEQIEDCVAEVSIETLELAKEMYPEKFL